ncbi:hypothetical protein OIU78_025792 [Salix suchowensis]|nr:hypothetical protein OIU78_025792 [Salix suchowensis]
MESASGFSTKDLNETKHFQNGGIGLNSDTILVLKLPDSRVMRVVSRSLFFVMIILTLPFIGAILRELNSSYYPDASGSASIDLEFFGLLLQDLAKEGLIKEGDIALIVFSDVRAVVDSSRFLNVDDIDFSRVSPAIRLNHRGNEENEFGESVSELFSKEAAFAASIRCQERGIARLGRYSARATTKETGKT